MLQRMQLVRGAAISAALATTVILTGCGHNDTPTNNAPIANFEFGQPDFNSLLPNRAQAPTNASLISAASVAANPNTLAPGAKFFIADTGNNRLLGFNSIPTSGSATADFEYGQTNMSSNNLNTTLNQPNNVKFSPDGSMLVVTDTGNNRVLIWSTHLSALTGTGGAQTTTPPDIIIGDGTSPTSASNLAGPQGASFAPNATYPNRLVVADTQNNRVLIYNDITAKTSADVVLGQRDFVSGSNQPNCPASALIVPSCSTGAFAVTLDSLSTPSDVWSDGGRLYISDTGNNRVLYFNSGVPTVSETAATYVIGQTTGRANNGFGAGATALHSPNGLWVDPLDKTLYIADTFNNRVLAFTTPTTNGPSAFAVYGQGDFNHVTSNDDDQNNVPDTNPNGNGRRWCTDRTLSGPVGMTTFGSSTASNNVFIADTNNSRIMVFPAN